MKHKVDELQGALLDAFVAMAEDRAFTFSRLTQELVVAGRGSAQGCADICEHGFRPSSLWFYGGPIIERERVMVWPTDRFCGYPVFEGSPTENYGAETRVPGNARSAFGPTPLIAAMRAFVKSKLGEEVELP